ncbi:hypothetical protein BT63DRAFT_129431 [Microthyrium microscopicum]|uniref:G domain-containing protein n=1 Tax=Microthyrium microscopicum TaxID=703497 RepID=A0A6A6TV68_9PEZI|nr:hypothetical protein BT63DRAFT_129431 [Microthyrium microscopicum]
MESHAESSNARGKEKLTIQRPSDIVIPVMGETGSAGKSTFISLCTGQDVGVGHGQLSYTSDCELYFFRHKGHTIWLIDTPGFDDSHIPDTRILADIAMWLGVAYAKKPKIILNGIIYLHPINEPKMQGTAKKNLEVFKNVCGEECMPSVVLATTFWEKVSLEDGERREEELETTDEFWGAMVKQKSRVLRHYNTRASALEIVEQFINKRSSIVLKIQREMIDEGLQVRDTVAGRKLEEKAIREGERAKSRLRDNQEELDEDLEENDSENVERLMEMQEKYKNEMQMSQNKLQDLRKNFDSLLKDKIAQEEQEKEAMEQQRQIHEDEMNRQREDMEKLLRRHDEMSKEADQQEAKMLALERTTSSLVLQRDKNLSQELIQLNTMDENSTKLQEQYRNFEEAKRQAEIQALELRNQAMMIQMQMDERERYRVMQEASYSRKITTSQLGVMTGALGISAAALILGPLCCIM